ncbi:MAG: hypothetical protein ATN35_04035 [Epulopiscium sp. Nele67-Bin004]|nr:MAG: hypothetical protein ATN35_04035 [Epulopiscium sp. Nele67-Bin004]
MLKIEMSKLLKRKDILMLFTMLVIPLFYSIGLYFDFSLITYNGETQEYALKFMVSMFEFVFAIFLYFFMLALSTSHTLAGEISNKSIAYYLQRINDRKKIYLSKKYSLIAIFSIICILFSIATIALYYIFVIHRPDVATTTFIVYDEVLFLFSKFIIIYLFYITIISYSLFLSTFVKKNLVILVTIFTLIILMYMEYIPIVQYLSPFYYITEISKLSPSSDRLIPLLLIGTVMHIFYNIICDTIGIKIFNKKDL